MQNNNKSNKNNEFSLNNKYGVSLVEIAVAVLFFAFAAIPVYYALSYGATQEIDMSKVSMANKVLAAFRDEVMRLSYDEAEGCFPAATFDATALPPETFGDLLTAQRDYKDFQFSGKVEKLTDPVDAMQFDIEITWSNAKGPERLEKISFMKVKK